MRKLILTTSIFIILCSCGGSEQKQINKSDSLSRAMDSARANDTLLQRLQKDTNN